MMGKERALEVLDSAISRVKADAAEALLYAGGEALTRFANNGIHQNVSEENALVHVRAIVGRRQGAATTNRLDARSLARAAKAAVELARRSPEDPEFPGLPEPGDSPGIDCLDSAAADCSPEERARMVCSIIEPSKAAGGVASGAISTGVFEFAIANSRGLRAHYARSSCDLNAVIAAGEGQGSGSGARFDNSWRMSDIDAPSAGAIALRKALDSRNAAPIEPGEYVVILEEPAVAELVEFMGYMGLGALAYQEGRSFLCGKLGQKVLDEKITVVDDGLDAAGLPTPFDGEGTPKKRIVLFERGVARNVVYDVRTAAKDGRTSTGHGSPAPNPSGPMPGNMLMEPGGSSLEEMIKSTKRGLLVTRFHYTNVAERSKATITGMTRDGTFLVENGRVTKPVRNLRFTESCLRALSAVELVGRERRRIGTTVVPALKLSSFRFTGATEF